jgi:hypothetical protein
MIAGASPVAAQGAIQFFPRYDFNLSAEHLSNDDPRFVWDTNFGGEMDFVDYGIGRTTFAANYEAILGEEFRRFDPNQGNYLLDLATSARTHGYEIAALLHHTSRHLGDRFKIVPVDWNMFGVAVERDVRRGALRIRPHGDLLGVLLKSSVDYTWEANAGADLRIPVSASTAAGIAIHNGEAASKGDSASKGTAARSSWSSPASGASTLRHSIFRR